MSLLPFPSRAFDKPLPPVPTQGAGDFCVTFDKKWLPYLLGAVGVLCAGGTWETDKERCIAEGMTLLSQLADGLHCEPTPEMPGIDIGEDCMGCCIRFGPNGRLQTFSCGEWTDVPGQGDGPLQPDQPGSGTPQPTPDGGTQEYCGGMAGLQKWLLPTTVSTGDVLLFDRLLGAWNDGIELAWHCPDGWLFVAGSCFQEPVYNAGTDPLMGTLHMSIVAKIGSTYYDVLNIDSNGTPQPFTIPAGYSDAQVTLQANVDYGGVIYGSVTFCVEVTRNSTPEVNITYGHGSGPTTVDFGTTIIVTAQDIGSDVRIDMTFDRPTKITILSSSGYVNTGAPGPTNVWCGWSLAGTGLGTLVDPPDTQPTDFPSPQVIDSLSMDTAAPGAVFTVTMRLDQP